MEEVYQEVRKVEIRTQAQNHKIRKKISKSSQACALYFSEDEEKLEVLDSIVIDSYNK